MLRRYFQQLRLRVPHGWFYGGLTLWLDYGLFGRRFGEGAFWHWRCWAYRMRPDVAGMNFTNLEASQFDAFSWPCLVVA